MKCQLGMRVCCGRDLLRFDCQEALGFFEEERNVHERLIADVDPANAIVSVEEDGCMEGVVFEVIESAEGFERNEVWVTQEVKLGDVFEVGEFGAYFDGFWGELWADGLDDYPLVGEGIEVL